MTQVNEFVQSLSSQFKITLHYIYMVIDDNWTHFTGFIKNNSGHKGLNCFFINIETVRFVANAEFIINCDSARVENVT